MTFVNDISQLVKKNRFFFIPYLCFLLAGSVILMAYSKVEIFLYINSLNDTWSDVFFTYFTHVGDGLFYSFVLLLLLFVRFKYAVIAALSFAVTSLLTQSLKLLVFYDAFRPSKFFEGSPHVIRYLKDIHLHSLHSFPSGHATTAFSVFCLLSLIAVRKGAGLLFFLFAFLAAYSRVYLAQHFFADVYFGSLVGTVPTLLIYYFMMNYFQFSSKTWHQKSLMKK